MRRSTRGFTLIELLVVIAIIAILAAILFPIFGRVRAMGRAADCLSNLSQIGKALKQYCSDSNGYMPPAGYWYGWNTAEKRPDPGAWTGRIWKYVGEEAKIFICKESSREPSYVLSWRVVTSTDFAQDPTSGSEIYLSSPRLIWCFEIDPKDGSTNNGDWDVTNEEQQDGEVTGQGSGEGWNKLYWPGPHRGRNTILFGDSHVKSFRKWETEKMTFRPITPSE